MKLFTYIYNDLSTINTLSITRIENQYFNAAAIERGLKAYRAGNILFLNVSIALSATIPSPGVDDFFSIAKISGWSAIDNVFQSVQHQVNQAQSCVIYITMDGTIKFYTASGFQMTSGWVRTNVSIPISMQ